MGAFVLAALNDLAGALVNAFAKGSSPAIALPDTVTPGLATCPKCGTDQRPMAHRFAVHYPTLTSARPCEGSWP